MVLGASTIGVRRVGDDLKLRPAAEVFFEASRQQAGNSASCSPQRMSTGWWRSCSV